MSPIRTCIKRFQVDFPNLKRKFVAQIKRKPKYNPHPKFACSTNQHSEAIRIETSPHPNLGDRGVGGSYHRVIRSSEDDGGGGGGGVAGDFRVRQVQQRCEVVLQHVIQRRRGGCGRREGGVAVVVQALAHHLISTGRGRGRVSR